MNIEGALKEAMTVDGALGAALVDYESGMALGFLGGGPNLALARHELKRMGSAIEV